jgi:large subunit ribosomal protein L15
MPHKLRKIRKKRGSRTVGYGRIGQHRGVGQRGGHGKAGRRKHLWSYILRYESDYFSKKGFYSPRSEAIRIINVGDLEDLVGKLSSTGKLEEREGLPFLDLDRLGIDKLLGRGNISGSFSVKVASLSDSASKKVEEAGGKIFLGNAG